MSRQVWRISVGWKHFQSCKPPSRSDVRDDATPIAHLASVTRTDHPIPDENTRNPE